MHSSSSGNKKTVVGINSTIPTTVFLFPEVYKISQTV
jgi:hypothetical protein